jgi:hypothetical protein
MDTSLFFYPDLTSVLSDIATPRKVNAVLQYEKYDLLTCEALRGAGKRGTGVRLDEKKFWP